MSRDQLPVIRLADIQRVCCAPDCNRAPESGLPIPLCSGCYDFMYQHALDEVIAKLRPLCVERFRPPDPEETAELRAAGAAARRERSVVYVLRVGDRYKIGFSTNLPLRLATVPYDEVLVTFPGGRTEERALHERFGAHRLVGEWFAINDETTAMVQRLIDWQARQAG